MKIIICSPKRVLYRGEGQKVICRTSSGEITILDHHHPLIAEVVPGVIKVLDFENKEYYFNVTSGFLEVNYLNSLKILVDESE